MLSTRQCCAWMGVLLMVALSNAAAARSSRKSKMAKPQREERDFAKEEEEEQLRINRSRPKNFMTQMDIHVDGWKKDDSFAAHEWTIDPLHRDSNKTGDDDDDDVAVKDWKSYAYSYLAGRSPLTIQLGTKLFVKSSKRNQQQPESRDLRMQATVTLGRQSYKPRRRFVSSWVRCAAQSYTLPVTTTTTSLAKKKKKKDAPSAQDKQAAMERTAVEGARELMKKQGITSSSGSGLSGLAEALEREPSGNLLALLSGRYEDHMLVRKNQLKSMENLEIEVMLPKPKWARRSSSKRQPSPVVLYSFPLGAGQIEGGDFEDDEPPVLICRTRGIVTLFPLGRKPIKSRNQQEEPPIAIPLGMTTFHRKTAPNLTDYNWSRGRKFFHFGRPVGSLTAR